MAHASRPLLRVMVAAGVALAIAAIVYPLVSEVPSRPGLQGNAPSNAPAVVTPPTNADREDAGGQGDTLSSRTVKGKVSKKSSKGSSHSQEKPRRASADEIAGKIFNLMEEGPVLRSIVEKFGRRSPFHRGSQWAQLSEEQRRELKELLSTREFHEFYGLLQELAQFDAIDSKIDHACGVDYISPLLPHIADIEKCLLLKSCVDMDDDLVDEAVDALGVGLKIAGQTMDDTIPTSAIVRMRLDHVLLDRLVEVARAGDVSADRLAELVGEAARRDYRGELVPSFDMDMEMMNNEFKRINAGDTRAIEEIAAEFGLADAVAQTFGSRESLDANLAACADYTRKFQELCGKPYHEALPELHALQNEIGQLPDDYALVKLLLSGNNDFISRANIMTDRLNQQLIQLATAIYKSRNQGASPQSTQDLVGILGHLPTNPFTGESY